MTDKHFTAKNVKLRSKHKMNFFILKEEKKSTFLQIIFILKEKKK